MSDEFIKAHVEFNEIYKEYTLASHRVYSARTEEEKREAIERLKIVFERFDTAYKTLKDSENDC